MSTQHTPGPWEAHQGEVTTRRLEGSSYRRIAAVQDYGMGSLPEIDKANARLIAAAPELLEAVLLAHKYMGIANFDYEESSEQDQDLHDETYLTIQDAIFKAIGQIP